MKAENNLNLDERILVIIDEMFQNTFGDSLSLKPSTTLDEILKTIADSVSFWDDLDITDLFYYLEIRFRLDFPEGEWDLMLGEDHPQWTNEDWERFCLTWTVQRLIDFIRDRLPEVSFDPVNICGKDCAPAGAFFGLRNLVATMRSRTTSLGPSSMLKETLTSYQLKKLWIQSSLLSGAELPPLLEKVPVPLMTAFFFVAGLISWATAYSLPVAPGMDGLGFIFVVFTAVFGALSYAGIMGYFRHSPFGYNLPKNVQTFRDLAEYIAKQPEFT